MEQQPTTALPERNVYIGAACVEYLIVQHIVTQLKSKMNRKK